MFGAIEEREDDSQRAVACAIAMQHGIRSVNVRNATRGLSTIEMGIGLATGEVIVGNIGAENRSKFTAVGSTVNLVGRLQAHAKDGEILVSPATHDDVVPLVEVDLLRELELKGFEGVIAARRVLAIGGPYAISM